MTEDQKKKALDGFYNKLTGYQHKKNAHILFNIIRAKSQFGLFDYNQSLYLDVKKFIISYIRAASKEDYGYDEISLAKIEETVKCLCELKQQKNILILVRRLFTINGYDIDEVSKVIKKLDQKMAWKDGKWFKGISLFLSSNFLMLILSYVFYLFLLSLVLLPAPFKWMELFSVKLKNYSNSNIVNHISNTLALVTGNDLISPSVIPLNFWGNLIYCIGLLLFYFFFVNFVFKKLEVYLLDK